VEKEDEEAEGASGGAAVDDETWIEQEEVRRALGDEIVSRGSTRTRSDEEVAKMKRLTPYYWAARVLSGNWR
jgi:hypothetical protein